MTAPDVLIIDEPTTELVEELLGARGPQGIPGIKGDKGDKGDPATLAISGTGFLFSTAGALAARPLAQADLPSLNLATLAATGALALSLLAAPANTGFAHVTNGAWDGNARALAQSDLPSLDLATLTSSNALPLAKLGAPTSSGFAHVSAGAWDTTARAIDLSTADTQGTLPFARVGVPAGSGVAQLTGGAWFFGNVNLATSVQGVLALANQAAPTSSGFVHVTAGFYDSAARAINLAGSDTTGTLSLDRVAPSGAGFPYWNGSAWASVAQVNLATQTTGTLPAASLPALGGDLAPGVGGLYWVQSLSGNVEAGQDWVDVDASSLFWDASLTPVLSQYQAAGTGATASRRLTLRAQQGRAQTGTANNNNGGAIRLQSGAPGTGGSGTTGNPGAIELYAGATLMGQLAGLSTDTLKVGPSTGVVITPTGITVNGVALGSGSAVTWAGDLLGSSSTTQTVVALRGASVPAAGALTTGNGLYVSGASALTYSALNLAGGAGWVTGVLPAANQAAQTMAGDVTGSTAASVVAKVNGATVPAGGALTTGNLLYVSGASALSYGPLNLAGGANYVTGALPAGNLGAGTQTNGFVLTLSGGAPTWLAAAGGSTATYETLAAWLTASTPLYAQADQTAASTNGALTTLRAQNATGTTSTGGELRLQSGTGTTAPGAVTIYAGTTKVLSQSKSSSTDFAAFGTLPATAGFVRLSVDDGIRTRNYNNTADITLLYYDSSQQSWFGNAATGAAIFATGGNLSFRGAAASFADSAGVNVAIQFVNIGASGATEYRINAGQASFKLYQLDATAASATGKLLTVQAQNATGTTSTGGELRLQSGTGTTAAGALTLYAGATERARAEAGGLAIGGGAGSYGGGVGVVYLKTAPTLPSSNPTGGGVLYVDAGALKYRGSSGTVTTLGVA